MRVIEAIPGAGVAIAAERIAVGAALPAHGHGFMELAVVAAGAGTHRTQSGARRLGQGEVVLIRPGQWHAYDDPDGLVMWNVYIAARTLTAELAALRSDPLVAALALARIADADAAAPGPAAGPAPPAGRPAAVAERIEPYLAALATAPDGSAGDGLQRLGNLLAVLAHLVPVLLARTPDPRPRALHPAVSAATDLLHADPARPWTLPDLARLVHLSAPHLCRCFVRDLGLSPLRYLERHRLELVAQQLLASDLTVSQISAQAGIADPNYLARRFRAAHGLAPSRYRAAFAPSRQGPAARDTGSRTCTTCPEGAPPAVPDQQIIIRDRAAADLDACVRGLADVHRTSGYPTNWPADPARWLTPPGSLHAWIATTSEFPVAGQLILRRAASDPAGEAVAEVSRLFVVPAARHRGVAQALLRQAIEWAAASDLDLMLEVTDHLRAARALYERTGFRLVSTDQAAWTAPDGQPVTLHTYRRSREAGTPAG